MKKQKADIRKKWQDLVIEYDNRVIIRNFVDILYNILHLFLSLYTLPIVVL